MLLVIYLDLYILILTRQQKLFLERSNQFLMVSFNVARVFYFLLNWDYNQQVSSCFWIIDCENGKVIIVCYCSLGYRSSLMAQKLYPHCKLLAETQKISFMPVIKNLEGSIFKWANEGREMIDCENRKTKCCHPYSFLWGKLLKSELKMYETQSNNEHKSSMLWYNFRFIQIDCKILVGS